MPAIAKVTKEMIIEAAFEIAKEMGAENINARTVSQKLGCSTQPGKPLDTVSRGFYLRPRR